MEGDKMNSTAITVILTFLLSFVCVIVTLIIISKKKNNKYKEQISRLDYEKNKLVGVPILSELSKVKELVKTDNLKSKLQYWDDEFKNIKDNGVLKLTDMITEADFLIDKKDYTLAIKKIASIEIEISYLQKKSDELLDEIKIITKSEERNRAIITKLKMIYRELKDKFERTSKDYAPIVNVINEEFSKIDLKFKNFEYAMDNNDYVSVEAIVIDLDKHINHTKMILNDSPSIVLMATILIPSRIEEIQTLYYRMGRDGYPLDYLNVEYNIDSIKKKINEILTKLKNLDLGDSELELKTILDYFNALYNEFEKEKESKELFKDKAKELKYKLDNVNKVVYDIYLQIDDIKSTYDLTDDEINKFSILNKNLEKINEDYKVLMDHSKGKTFAYSKLLEELEGLSKKLIRLQDDLDFRLRSITSMKDDESRAKEQCEMIENLLKKAKDKLKEYKIPVIPNHYFTELKEAGDAIKEINKELCKKPIVIKILNIRVDTARDLVFKIYNNTNDMIKTALYSENLIIYANRYRSTYPEVGNILDKSEDLFNKGKYKESMDLTLNLIKKVDEEFTLDV